MSSSKLINDFIMFARLEFSNLPMKGYLVLRSFTNLSTLQLDGYSLGRVSVGTMLEEDMTYPNWLYLQAVAYLQVNDYDNR